jgi:hypothetical protein
MSSSNVLLRLAICILTTLHIVHVDSTDLSVAFDSAIAANSKQVETAAAVPSNYRTLARYTVCNMTRAFPALASLPKPWSCPMGQNVTWCDFTGVTCRPTVATVKPFLITELKLTKSSLHGMIPSALSNLQFGLVNMVLDSNSIYGTIPSQLGNLLALTAMYLQTNSLQGTVPLALTKLTNLKIFNANFNYMTGTLPSWFKIMNITNNVTSSSPATFVLSTPMPTGQPSVHPSLMPLNSARPTRSPTATVRSSPNQHPFNTPFSSLPYSLVSVSAPFPSSHRFSIVHYSLTLSSAAFQGTHTGPLVHAHPHPVGRPQHTHPLPRPLQGTHRAALVQAD